MIQLETTKTDKNCFYFKCAINVSANCRIICTKMNTCPLNVTFLHKFLYRITIRSMKTFFLTEKLTNN